MSRYEEDTGVPVPRVAGDGGGPDRSDAPMAMVLEELGKRYLLDSGEFTALEHINLTVGVGEFLCVLGSSGCGKTTLLRILGGLERHTHGTLKVRQQVRGKPPTSIVFQEVSIFPWLNVWDNVAYGLRMRDAPRSEVRDRVGYFLDKVGLTDFARHLPHQLSGGMKQRVSIARAFANDPEILLLDEPFSALDERNKRILQEELLRIWEETGKTIIFVTHSVDEAIFLADRILVFAGPPGRIVQTHRMSFPRPRDLLALQGTAAYQELVTTIHRGLAAAQTRPLEARSSGGADG